MLDLPNKRNQLVYCSNYHYSLLSLYVTGIASGSLRRDNRSILCDITSAVQYDEQCMYYSRNPSKNGKYNIEDELSIAAPFQGNCKWGKDKG